MLEARTLAAVARLEGIACGPEGDLFGSDDAGRVFRIDPDGAGETLVAQIDGWGLGLACDGAGHLYVCTSGPEAVVRVDLASGASETWCDTIGGLRFTMPNFPVFAPDGTLYVSDSGPETPGALSGSVVAIPPGCRRTPPSSRRASTIRTGSRWHRTGRCTSSRPSTRRA